MSKDQTLIVDLLISVVHTKLKFSERSQNVSSQIKAWQKRLHTSICEDWRQIRCYNLIFSQSSVFIEEVEGRVEDCSFVENLFPAAKIAYVKSRRICHRHFCRLAFVQYLSPVITAVEVTSSIIAGIYYLIVSEIIVSEVAISFPVVAIITEDTRFSVTAEVALFLPIAAIAEDARLIINHRWNLLHPLLTSSPSFCHCYYHHCRHIHSWCPLEISR